MSKSGKHLSYRMAPIFLELESLLGFLGHARAVLTEKQDPRLDPYSKVLKMIQQDVVHVIHLLEGEHQEMELKSIEEATGQMERYTQKFSQSVQIQEPYTPGESVLESVCNLAQISAQRVEYQISLEMDRQGTQDLISAHLYINRLREFLLYFVHLV